MNKSIQIFRVRDSADAKKKFKRRQKRSDGKKISEATAQESSGNVFHPSQLSLGDELEVLPSHTIRCAARVRGFAFDPTYKSTGKDGCRALVSMINNSLEIFQIPYVTDTSGSEDSEPPSKLSVIDLHGHRYVQF